MDQAHRQRTRRNERGDDMATTTGCGKRTHVMGTNGGTMPCGALLSGSPYFCDACEAAARVADLKARIAYARRKDESEAEWRQRVGK